MKFLILVTLLFMNIARADIEMSAFQSIAKVYALDPSSLPDKLQSNIAYGIALSSDVKFSSSIFFEYGLKGKIFHFSSPEGTELENNFSSINEYFLGIKKVSENSIYKYRFGFENFLFYRLSNSKYQIVRINPFKLSFAFQNRFSKLQKLKYELGVKTLIPISDNRDSGKVGFGGIAKLSYDLESDQANFSPFLETEYSIKQINNTNFFRFDLTIGFNITINIREKRSKLF